MNTKSSIALITATYLAGGLLAWVVKPARAARQPGHAPGVSTRAPEPSAGPAAPGEPAGSMREGALTLNQLYKDAKTAADDCRPYQSNIERGGDWQRDHLRSVQEAAEAKATELDRFAQALKAGLPEGEAVGRAADAVLDLHDRRRAVWAAWLQEADFGRYHSIQEIMAPGQIRETFVGFQIAASQAQQEETLAEQTADHALKRLLDAAGVAVASPGPARRLAGQP
jgi:hypothetical protein